MRKVGMENGKVTLPGTYEVDHNNRIVYSLGADKSGNYYSVEDHEYNVGSAYDMYRDYYLLEDSEVADLRQRARVRGHSLKLMPFTKTQIQVYRPVCAIQI